MRALSSVNWSPIQGSLNKAGGICGPLNNSPCSAA